MARNFPLKAALTGTGDLHQTSAGKLGIRPEKLSRIISGVINPSKTMKAKLAKLCKRKEAELFQEGYRNA
jgi:hypothetical protein